MGQVEGLHSGLWHELDDDAQIVIEELKQMLDTMTANRDAWRKLALKQAAVIASRDAGDSAVPDLTDDRWTQ